MAFDQCTLSGTHSILHYAKEKGNVRIKIREISGSHRCRWPCGNSSWPAGAGGRRI